MGPHLGVECVVINERRVRAQLEAALRESSGTGGPRPA